MIGERGNWVGSFLGSFTSQQHVKSHGHLDWPRLSYREQFKEEDEDAGRGNDGKTTSKGGLALNGTS